MAPKQSETVSSPLPSLDPGDEALPGTPGTGQDTCRQCEGTGRLNGKPCPACAGTGFVVQGIGGG